MKNKPQKEKNELESNRNLLGAMPRRDIQLLKLAGCPRSFLEQLVQGVSTDSAGSPEILKAKAQLHS